VELKFDGVEFCSYDVNVLGGAVAVMAVHCQVLMRYCHVETEEKIILCQGIPVMTNWRRPFSIIVSELGQ
jgi:hypothetical protein